MKSDLQVALETIKDRIRYLGERRPPSEHKGGFHRRIRDRSRHLRRSAGGAGSNRQSCEGRNGVKDDVLAASMPASLEYEDHDYTSTACYHGQHDRCRQLCKFCLARCQCRCHHLAPEDHT